MLEFRRITESNSNHNDLEKKSSAELLTLMNQEDRQVAESVQVCIPEITKLVEAIVEKLKNGGRLFYIGAGTSGRLGILDASECPPTFGVSQDLVIGIIAGGDSAIRKAVEGAEDDHEQAWRDLVEHKIDSMDVVVGIAASGTTPYVVHGLKKCQESGIITACITCNPGSHICLYADHKIVCIVGPELVTGSTRLKSGTAQKLILNMISTVTMIRLGRVQGNRMVDMQLNNAKLVERGISMIRSQFPITNEEAMIVLLREGSVRKAIYFLSQKI